MAYLRLVLYSSFLCLVSAITSAIIYSNQIYVSDFLRPIFYFFFITALVQFAKPTLFWLNTLPSVFVVLGFLQTIFVALQFYFPGNGLIVYISSFFARPDLIDVTWQAYSRSLGFFGGPAASGVFCTTVCVFSAYLRFQLLISPRFDLFIKLTQLLASLYLSSKGSLFVISLWILADIVFGLLVKFELSRKTRINILTIVLAFSLIVFLYFVFIISDVSSMRQAGGISAFLSASLRLSSFYGRIENLGYFDTIFSDPLRLIVVSSLHNSVNVSNRVFDSDILYFISVYGIAGVFLVYAFFSMMFSSLYWLTGYGFLPYVFLASLLFNPHFSASYACIPFLLSLSLPIVLRYKTSCLGSA